MKIELDASEVKDILVKWVQDNVLLASQSNVHMDYWSNATIYIEKKATDYEYDEADLEEING